MIREANEKLRQEAKSEYPTTSRNIVRDVRANLSADVRVNAPSVSYMRRNFNYAKQKHREEVGDVGLDALPVTEIIIPQPLQERVIYNEVVLDQRILVFGSEFGLNMLRDYNAEIAVDGTFESCPRGFAQLYTVSAIVEHCAVPCIYGLLPNKRQDTYIRFYEAIRNNIGPNWYPTRIMSDFEIASIAAANYVFPNSIQSGCLFHFGKALHRKIQTLGNLHAHYLNNEDFQMSIRSLQALAFVRPEYVYNYFCALMSTLEPNADLHELIMYFVNTYIGPRYIIENEAPLVDIDEENHGGVADAWIRDQIIGRNLANREALFRINLWNMVDRVDQGLCRTNNSVEGWHSIWNIHLKGNRRLSSFIRKMIDEDNMWSNRIEDYQAAPADGIHGPHENRKSKYIRQDNNLVALCHDFDNREPLAYLRACAHHLHF